jgi:hypothetical protein
MLRISVHQMSILLRLPALVIQVTRPLHCLCPSAVVGTLHARLCAYLIPHAVLHSWGTVALATFIGTITWFAKDDLDVYKWAERQAKAELEAEGAV